MKKESTIDSIIEKCIDLSYGQAEGCLFAIETAKPSKQYYKRHEEIYKSKGKKLSVLNKNDRIIIKNLARIDGAMIISKHGELLNVGATLIYSKNFAGHGKRHAFSIGTTKLVPEVVCILASEEDRKIRTFKNGLCITEIDAETKLKLSTKRKVVELLTSKTAGILIAGGIATSLLTLNPIPAIVTITGTQIVTRVGFDRLKEFFKRHRYA